MTVINRRSVVRSASVLFALPFTGALQPAYASEQSEAPGGSQLNRIRLSKSAGTAVSLDFVNYVKDHTAQAVAAGHRGATADYAALGDQFHMLGKHLSLAGADKHIRAHCKKLLKTGTAPAVDPKVVAHAVACIQAYAPSYLAKELLSSSSLPTSPNEWAVELKKLKKKGLVKYCHRAARQLNAMGHASNNRSGAGSVKSAAYDPNDAAQAAHIMDICSMSQKAKFFACIGATVVAGLLVLAAVVAICGATALAACFGGGTVAYVFFGGFGLVAASLLALCSAFLASYHEKSRPPAALSTI